MECGVCGECAPPAEIDEVMLAAVESENSKITLGVDFGAAVSVLKPDVASDYPLARVTGRKLMEADGSEITAFGDRQVGLRGSDGRTRIPRCGVADVRKNFAVVSQLVDQDHDVVFSKRGSYIFHRPTGWKIEMIRTRDVFEIETDVVPYFRVAPPPAGRR